MVKARCPVCDELVPIVQTAQQKHPNFSAMWWEVLPHPAKFGDAERCIGTGRKV